MGCKTLYRPEFAELARNYSLIGALEGELGPLFKVSDRTIRNWKRDHPEFAKAVEEGAVHANANVVGQLYRNCMRGDNTAIIWWTKNKMGWREKVAVDANVNGKLDLNNLSDEQLDKIITELGAALGLGGASGSSQFGDGAG
ncbi:hypothetical protein PIN31009_05552 [Pandoraea iniqua]|uniref:hypothetical protein n=1 Tax=Pandoraea iniqua TaxID=2508288 RepID=UPI0012412301|nr:hypothetical protein [Pandoraea iniqua]VVE59483.1 hypothetical protein PIN31009_05552 [Pandoraea iniqua]